MLFLDRSEVKHCKLRDKDKPVSAIIYNSKIFTRAKAFPKEELEVAIKECRENFLDNEERSQIATLLVKGKSSIGIWLENKQYKKEDILEISRDTDFATEELVQSTNSSQPKSRLNLKKVAAEMRSEKGITVKTRRHKLKLYQHCFLGNEAVDWIAKNTQVSRSEAVKIGQKMLERGIFSHVSNDHEFKDESLFYRFTEDKEKSFLSSKI